MSTWVIKNQNQTSVEETKPEKTKRGPYDRKRQLFTEFPNN